MKIVFITQNEAPFRMKWIDEIAKYFQVVVFHTGEYEKNFNADFLTYKPERAVVYNMAEEGKTSFDLNMIIKEKADIYILDGYGFRAQQELIIKFSLKKTDLTNLNKLFKLIQMNLMK